MARFLAQIIMLGGQVVGRAFAQALRQEFQSGAAAKQASKGAQEGAKRAAANSMMGMTLQMRKTIFKAKCCQVEMARVCIMDGGSSAFTKQIEAKQILNVQDLHAEKITESYDHLFKINEKANGGSFYLQSKVVRAKERLDEEIRLQDEQNKTKQEKENSNSEPS